ncbi:hypothetical protein H4219_003397 [Mycoemilia scoparia]|uniref:tRNA N(3)-methylcytidine methyltransferase n=1 Tax=Mycoemilia scoparia TaxID=417184 RepID=A0A9W7ZYV3_9FUNG|nr:hypothetical protein H4219_003397 [Mycoemilia scoparia]
MTEEKDHSNPETKKKLFSSVMDIRNQTPSSPLTTTNSTETLSDNSNNDKSSSQTFGCRTLDNKDDVFQYNAWDHVDPGSDHERHAQEMINVQKQTPVPSDTKEQFNNNPNYYWNKFYENNQNRFFKDRKWLKIEFPELYNWREQNDQSNSNAGDCDGKFRVLELGCGAGNAIFPLLQDISDPRLFVHACDFSKTAVDVVKSTIDDIAKQEEDETSGGNINNCEIGIRERCNAFVWDISSPQLPLEHIEPGSIDIILLIFVFSALHPDQWKQTIDNLEMLLKPGGMILFRDYGRHDLAQLRFKKNRYLDENFYARGDGTRVYFFTSQQIEDLFTGKNSSSNTDDVEGVKKFQVLQNAIDRRLLVNRKQKVKMYRVWLQAKFRKPLC